MHDSLKYSRRLRILTALGRQEQKHLAVEVDASLSVGCVIRELRQIFRGDLGGPGAFNRHPNGMHINITYNHAKFAYALGAQIHTESGFEINGGADGTEKSISY